MTRRLLTLTLAAATLAIAACGNDSPASSGAASGGGTVSVKTVDGTKQVLVDSAGAPLYAADQEKGGSIMCTAGCVAIWKPLTIGSGSPTGDVGDGKLDVVKRDDGSRQVTFDGKPLYTFTQGSSGKLSGDGVKDSFSGTDFTWHVVTQSGKSSSSGSGSGGGGGYSY
jgi:predicted lipoprotein with Yx(FWY)xxD motif